MLCKSFIRLSTLLLCHVILVISLSGCNTITRNYVSQKADSDAELEKAKAIHGSINVILLPGCADNPEAQDTLFSCLKLSRDVNPEAVKLPPDEKLYLGHVAEFILRALKHYQLQECFKDFYGCRIIMKFRKLTPEEMRSRKFTDYSLFAVGAAGTVASVVTMLPLNGILFLADGVKTEIDRQEFAERVARMGLPPPKKGLVALKLEEAGRTLLYVKDKIEEELTGHAGARITFADKVASYLVEECIMEKVSPEEIDLYRQRIANFKKI